MNNVTDPKTQQIILDKVQSLENLAGDLRIAKKLCSLSSSAASRGIAFNLSFKRLKELLTTKNCYYTGVPFVTGHPQNQRTLDRINNDLGYIDSNVIACTKQINNRKANLTITELKQCIRGVLKHEKKLKVKKQKEKVKAKVKAKMRILKTA